MLLCASFLLALLWAGSQGFCAAPTVACWAPRRLFILPSLMGVSERRAKINIKVYSEFLIAVCVSFRVRVVNGTWKVVDKVMDSYCFVPLPITVSCGLYFSIPCTWPVWDNHAECLGTPQHTTLENPMNHCFGIRQPAQHLPAFSSASPPHVEWAVNKSAPNRKGRCAIRY